jgi:hypothetical protein
MFIDMYRIHMCAQTSHRHVSCIMYVSCVMYHVSCVMYHVSCMYVQEQHREGEARAGQGHPGGGGRAAAARRLLQLHILRRMDALARLQVQPGAVVTFR